MSTCTLRRPHIPAFVSKDQDSHSWLLQRSRVTVGKPTVQKEKRIFFWKHLFRFSNVRLNLWDRAHTASGHGSKGSFTFSPGKVYGATSSNPGGGPIYAELRVDDGGLKPWTVSNMPSLTTTCPDASNWLNRAQVSAAVLSCVILSWAFSCFAAFAARKEANKAKKTQKPRNQETAETKSQKPQKPQKPRAKNQKANETKNHKNQKPRIQKNKKQPNKL